jgi:hypothetical protein
MPTPPLNLPHIVEQFPDLMARLKDEAMVVADLSAPKRHRDKAALARIRASGRCLFPGCSEWKYANFKPDPHHVKTRGAGGSDRPAEKGKRGNVVPLCRTHHDMAHDGTLPKEFFAWVADLED